MNNVRDYKMNIGTFVIFETLQSLEATFDGSLPPDVEEEIKKLKNMLMTYFEPDDPEFDDYDYKDTEYWHNGLMNVKPCTFRYKYGDYKKTKIGVIAEDLIEYMPELVLLDEDGKCDTVTYIDFIIPLVSEVQRLNKEIDRLENLIKGVQA